MRRGSLVTLLVLSLLIGGITLGCATTSTSPVPTSTPPTSPSIPESTPPTILNPEPPKSEEVVYNFGKWWLEPQTYHYGEDPEAENIPLKKITVIHDWSFSTCEEDAKNPYWSYDATRQRYTQAHQLGIKVEAVVSLLDIFFIEVDVEDPLYHASGISLNGEHIQYDFPGFVGCSNNPLWQEWLENRMKDAIDLGADGIITDDYEGTSRWSTGPPPESGEQCGCFCSYCEEGFSEYLKSKCTTEELAKYGITDIDNFDYSEYLVERGWTEESLYAESMKYSGWGEQPRPEVEAPLYDDYHDFQNQQILEFTRGLKDSVKRYAQEEHGREIHWPVNMPGITYETHKFFPLYERNIGGISFYGFPPKGTASHWYKLNYEIFDSPRIRETPMGPMFVAAVNEFNADNLVAIKYAEAYANKGAWNEMGYYLEEHMTYEEELQAFHTPPSLTKTYNSFYLDHEDVFDFRATDSMAKVAVLHASPSIRNNLPAHLNSFMGICEILTDSHVQYDPIFTGDGISYDDTLTKDVLHRYEVVFLPSTISLTDSQVEAILDFVYEGGTIVALGDVGETDENNEKVVRSQLSQLLEHRQSQYGSGVFYHMREDVFRADSIIDEGTHDIATAYQIFYIDYNPVVLNLIDEEPGEYISDSAAEDIRSEIEDIVNQSLSARVTPGNFSKDVGIQVYYRVEPSKKIYAHFINYDYELQQDQVNDKENIPVEIRLPVGFDAQAVGVISPDFEGTAEIEFTITSEYINFTVPQLHVWDVVVIE